MIRVHDLTIYLPGTVVLSKINLEVKKGEIVALVGPNGAGKSALLKAMTGGFSDMEGEVKINSFSLRESPEKTKIHIGYLPNPVELEPYITGLEWLEIVGTAYRIAPKARMERILQLADLLDCREELYTTNERSSQATKQKIGLISTLLAKPTVILWDEPLTHLDPESQQATLVLLEEQASSGTSFIIATNNLSLAQEHAHRVVVIDDGEIITEGSLKELQQLHRSSKRGLDSVYEQIIHE